MKMHLYTLVYFIIALSGSLSAQNTIPDWMTIQPSAKGYVYGVGEATSSDLPMAIQKARILALTDLTMNYNAKFESYSLKCDTILGADNSIRKVITSFKKNQEATLKGVEEVDKVVHQSEDGNKVYLLLKLDVNGNIKTIKMEADKDADLRKKMNKTGLMKELDKL